MYFLTIPDLPPLAETMGPCLIGTFLSCVFYGLTALQAIRYFYFFRGTDNVGLLVLVAIIWFLNTFGVLANCFGMYFYLVLHAEDPLAILTINWSLSGSIISTVLVACLVQCSYAYRVWLLSYRNFLFPLAIVCSLKEVRSMLLMRKDSIFIGIGWIRNILCLNAHHSRHAGHHPKGYGLGLSFGADVLTTSSIYFFLSRGRRGFHRTDTIIQKLIGYTITTGLISTLFTLTTLILGEVFVNTYRNVITFFSLFLQFISFSELTRSLTGLGQVNAFTLLTFFNMRDPLRMGPSQNTGRSIQLSELTGRPKESDPYLNDVDVDGSLDVKRFDGSAPKFDNHGVHVQATVISEVV
ncbi:hypothetical protein C8J56DRAFT_1171185 [Mycena floridula]|nr:hypothetical protein C8J56DRAFT_1171185 [Mycena floridula]